MHDKTRIMSKEEFETACGCTIIFDLERKRSLMRRMGIISLGIITAALWLVLVVAVVALF